MELRKCKYDDDEEEFWVDIRTSGLKGFRELEGIKDKTNVRGEVDGMSAAAKPADLDNWDLKGPSVCQVETGKDKVTYLYMRA